MLDKGRKKKEQKETIVEETSKDESSSKAIEDESISKALENDEVVTSVVKESIEATDELKAESVPSESEHLGEEKPEDKHTV